MALSLPSLPLVTTDLPGVGGQARDELEDFIVEEIPAYEPQGHGAHLFLWVEKREVEAGALIDRVASGLGVKPRDVGMAGRKDKRAVTRQWVSVPWRGAAPTAPEAIDLGPGVRVLAARLHGNKLRTGHLRANRFTLRLRGVVADAERRVRAKLDLLGRRGLPNFYGEQRFGGGAAQVERGRAVFRGEARRPRQSNRARFQASMVQGDLFNRYLIERMRRGWFARAVRGDVLKKADTGGLFVCSEPEVDQARVDSLDVHPTGPIYGGSLWWAEGEAGELERDVLARAGLDKTHLQSVGKLASGSRRPVRIAVTGLAAHQEGDTLQLSFVLPKGSYATRLLAELMQPLGSARTGDKPPAS